MPFFLPTDGGRELNIGRYMQKHAQKYGPNIKRVFRRTEFVDIKYAGVQYTHHRAVKKNGGALSKEFLCT